MALMSNRSSSLRVGGVGAAAAGAATAAAGVGGTASGASASAGVVPPSFFSINTWGGRRCGGSLGRRGSLGGTGRDDGAGLGEEADAELPDPAIATERACSPTL